MMSRKQILRIIVALGITMIVLVSAFVWWLNAPYYKARILLSTLDYHKGRRDDALGPSMGGLQFWVFSLNTFTDEIETWCIKSLYADICQRLQEQFGVGSLATYTYGDEEGWPRQVTVVRLREDLSSPSYLAVTALQNNDNDMIHFEHVRGVFDVNDKVRVESWALSPDILRP